ncbi:MAG TPA: class I tRNA ligase family protein, partial [Thermoplasmata archaeon]|nr:class I tRNA ligase family protein [Thermoplasmata archaeon]
AEAATGKAPLVNYWMHAGMLQFRGEKMSKSLGNVVALQAAIRQHGPRVLRFYYLNAQYRSPLNYLEGESLDEAAEAYGRLAAPFERVADELALGGPDRPGRELPAEVLAASSALTEQLDETLAQDFATREAIAALFGWSRTVNEWLPHLAALSGASLGALGAPYRWGEEVLGLFGASDAARDAASWGRVVEVAVSARKRARDRGDFAEADRIRDALLSAGIRLEDEGAETRWRRTSGAPG